MSNLPIELIAILAGAGLAALALVLIRWGKQIARALLIAAVLVVAGIFGVAMLSQALATRQATEAVEVATVANTAQSGVNTFLVVALVLAVVGALLSCGYFWLRWRIAERGGLTLGPGRQPRQMAGWRTGPGALPTWPAEWSIPPEIYYIEQDPSEIPPTEWGW